MCGLAGVFRFGDDPITEDQIKLLLCELEGRGADATGIAFSDSKGKIVVYKTDENAWNFVRNKKFLDFLDENLTDDTITCLLHTRYATIGNPREFKNNHPLSLGKGAIVHNGGISNHKDLFNKYQWERSAETDSDIIRGIVDEHGLTPKAIKVLNEMDGSCAAACIHPDFPKRIMLLRSGSPMEIAKVGTSLMFASTRQAIYLASRPWTEWKGFWAQAAKSPIEWVVIGKDSALIISQEKGLEYHSEFKPCRWYSTPDYSRVRTDFQDRNERFNREASATSAPATTTEKFLKAHNIATSNVTTMSPTHKPAGKYWNCKNPTCKTELMLPKKYADTPLWKLHCPTCNTRVADEPKDGGSIVTS